MKKLLAILAIVITFSLNMQGTSMAMPKNVEELPGIEVIDFYDEKQMNVHISSGYQNVKGNKLIIRYQFSDRVVETEKVIFGSYLRIDLGRSTTREYKMYYQDSNNQEHYLGEFNRGGYISDINSNSSYVSGNLTPDSNMEIVANGDTYKIKTSSGGFFDTKIKKYPMDTEVEFIIKNELGNKSIYRKTVGGEYVDIPEKIYPNSTYIKGDGPSNGTIEVTIGNKTYSSKADSEGNYIVTYPKQSIGTKVSLVAYNSRGHVSKTVTGTIKTYPIYISVDSGKVRPNAISGKTERNSDIKVSIGNKVYTGKSNSYGNFKIKYPIQKVDTQIKLQVIDVDGQKSPTKTYKVAPRYRKIEKIEDLDLDVEYIAGYWGEEYGDKIEIKVGGKTYIVNMEDNPSWRFKIKIPKQKLGTEVKIKGTDINGYSTKTYTYKIANKPIKLKVNYVSTRKNKVSGITEAYAKVKITVGKKSYNVKADKKGNFSAKVGYLNENTSVQIKVTNSKGYSSSTKKLKAITSEVELSSNSIGANSTKITGKVIGNISGDYVEVKIGSKKYKGKISKNKYSIKIPKQKHNKKYTIRVMGKNKNILESKSMKVYRTDYVKVGMSKKQVKESTWGKPTRINTYSSKYGTTEQWVYVKGKKSISYLYFEKGKLTNIQNFK